MEKAPAYIPNLRTPLVSDIQGNVYSRQRQIEEVAYLGDLDGDFFQLHRHGMQIAPSHVKRESNTWAGFTPDLQLSVESIFSHSTFVRSILVNRIFDWSPAYPCRAPGQAVAASCLGFRLNGTGFLYLGLVWLGVRDSRFLGP